MNLFDQLPENASEEIFMTLLSAESVRIERIISFGQKSSESFWYDQAEHEWILLLEGSATLEFKTGDPVNLTPGDHLNIPSGTRHRVEKTDENKRTVWLAVFYK